jgi:hypothetical protein
MGSRSDSRHVMTAVRIMRHDVADDGLGRLRQIARHRALLT